MDNFKNFSLHRFSSDFLTRPLYIFSRSYIASKDNNYKKLVKCVIAFVTLIICQNPEEQEGKRFLLFL